MLWFIITLSIVVILWMDTRRPKMFPPGPPWMPWFGNTLQVRTLGRLYGGPHGVFEYLARKYRSQLIGMRLGRERAVAVLGYPLAKEALSSADLQGRPDNFFIRMRTTGQRLGITFIDGNPYEEQKKFVLRTLKEVGYGSQRMHDIICRELDELIGIIHQSNGPITPSRILPPSILNILWTLVSGSRVDSSDKRLNDLFALLKKRSAVFDMAGGLLNQMPWLRFLIPEWSGYNLLLQFNRQLIAFFDDTIRYHRETYSEERSSQDLIYAYIGQIRKHSHNCQTTFTETQMIMVILDLFIAGAQNTALIIDLLLMMMVIHPDVQAKIHAEIDTLDEAICWTDRCQLPYAEAVILEVQRIFHTAAISGPRRAVRDCEIGGFRIPKDTSIFVDLKSVHMDKEYWKDPEVFRPERFISECGQIANTERLLSYSLGSRRCMGDSLAKASIFTYFVGILQHFKIALPDGETILPSTKLTPGINYVPKPYKVVFIPRV